MSSRIPINLAAQPVERTRSVRRVLGLLGLGLAVVTVLHAGLFLWVTRGQGDIDVAPRPAVAPEQLAAWRTEVDRLTDVADVDRARLAAGAVDLGNELINWRTIPWRSIFADLEEVLPRRVRLEVVAPGIGAEETLEVQLTAAARDTGPLQDLMLALEAHPAFEDVWPTREDAGIDEFVRLTLRARYVPQPAVEAVP
jgi:Tfp pilus assembly protein PilN